MKKRARWLRLGMLLSLTACGTPKTSVHPATPIPGINPTSAPVVDPCVLFGPLTFDRLNDTLPTIAGIKAHNAKWTVACATKKG